MEKIFDLETNPHSRKNILTGEWTLVSPHRTKRPWQGKIEDSPAENRPSYDPKCYLCPANDRADGDINPNYKESFVFKNDFSALLEKSETGVYNHEDLLVAKSQTGICKVISFSPRHDLTLPELSVTEITQLIKVWKAEFQLLAKNKWIKNIQIFENKGEIMGCSNPHPHGQIWAQSDLPVEVQKETEQQKKHYDANASSLLGDYLAAELEINQRVVYQNEAFAVLVPFWAVWPYETIIISRRHLKDITEFSETDTFFLADAIKVITSKYDNLFETSFPYSAGMHQAPVNNGNHEEWHWHMHFYPPLLRSATVKKFMVGYEMLGNPQRDITPELAANKLKELPTIHYKQNKR
jgi:UDPglucose--hexose-1-phosphate uridylyltransferase